MSIARPYSYPSSAELLIDQIAHLPKHGAINRRRHGPARIAFAKMNFEAFSTLMATAADFHLSGLEDRIDPCPPFAAQ